MVVEYGMCELGALGIQDRLVQDNVTISEYIPTQVALTTAMMDVTLARVRDRGRGQTRIYTPRLLSCQGCYHKTLLLMS